jgi:anti-anti-sigma factor
MGQAAPSAEPRPSGRSPADLETESGSTARVRTAELRLKVVGGSRIDVAAIGDFDAASCDAVQLRLDRLVAGGPGCLHVDCSQVASMDPAAAELFARVRDRLQSNGGSLELIDAPAELHRAMSVTPDAGVAQTSATAVAS